MSGSTHLPSLTRQASRSTALSGSGYAWGIAFILTIQCPSAIYILSGVCIDMDYLKYNIYERSFLDSQVDSVCIMCSTMLGSFFSETTFAKPMCQIAIESLVHSL